MQPRVQFPRSSSLVDRQIASAGLTNFSLQKTCVRPIILIHRTFFLFLSLSFILKKISFQAPNYSRFHLGNFLFLNMREHLALKVPNAFRFPHVRHVSPT